jgi:hypothetical protein
MDISGWYRGLDKECHVIIYKYWTLVLQDPLAIAVEAANADIVTL